MKKLVILIFICLLSSEAPATSFKPNVLDPAYSHDYWETRSQGITKQFRAYTSNFDDDDDDNADGTSDIWGVPQWVAYEIKETHESCIKTYNRPSTWITDSTLIAIMPDDDSYAYPAKFTKKRKDWFSRGHLAMKMHAERLGQEAGWNTHTFYNAVPQRQLFNAGIWQDLENLTAAWAQRYGAVWVITGPIFADKAPNAFIGEEGEMPVAIPDAFFKIVIKEGEESNIPDVLAFIYPQVGPGYYRGKPYDHTRYLTTVDEIEKLTGIDFLTRLSASQQRKIESEEAFSLWFVEKLDFINACNS